ncbi:MAG: tyrosine-type recombinase/integrase [Chloroflexi bacterium]|nr:tyrosine-type recombinase/integrase [Chloroflexota bacterium]
MGLSVEAFISNLRTEAGYSSHTLQAYASDLNRFIEYLHSELGHSPGSVDFNPKHVTGFINSERRGGLQESTLYRRRASIRRFVKYLYEGGFIEKEQFIEQNKGLNANQNLTLTSLQPAILTEKDTKTVLEEIGSANSPRASRDFAIIILLLETGISIGALVELNVSDLNLRKKIVRVSFGDSNEGTWIQIEQSHDPLRHYLLEGRPNLTDSLSEPALFASQMGGRMSRQGVWQGLRNWGEKAGLEQRLSPRLLRHTAVKRMISNGLTITEIQHLLGHRNPLSTRALLRRLKAAGKNNNK